MSKSERTQVLLTPAQRAKAERIAKRRGISVGAVLRDALDGYLEPDDDERARAVEALLGLGVTVADWEIEKARLVATRFSDRDAIA